DLVRALRHHARGVIALALAGAALARPELLLDPVLQVFDGIATDAKLDEMQHVTLPRQTVMRSRPSTISPEKFLRTSSGHMASVIVGSSPGTKWLITSFLTCASAATWPSCSVVVWLASRCSRSVLALGTRDSRRSSPCRCSTSCTSTSAFFANAMSSGE